MLFMYKMFKFSWAHVANQTPSHGLIIDRLIIDRLIIDGLIIG